MTDDHTPVWFITGCSTGFGRDLAECALERGFRVVATARDVARVADLALGRESRVLPCPLDVTDTRRIAAAVAAAQARFGAIDVLVNNAGHGYQTSVEEAEESEIRAQFETNVFALFAVTRAVLPGMRARRRGHVLNLSSIAGLLGIASYGYYAATKHAIEGWSDALESEVAPLGIKVTCVEPGPFRTDFAGRSLHRTANAIADYDATVGARMAAASLRSGSQAGDPRRAAEIMIRITEIEAPPRHLVLGASGYEMVTRRLAARLAQIEAWRDTAIEADFPSA